MRNARGFTIVEILVVLIILGIVLAMAAMVTRGVSAGQKRSLTTTRLTGVDAAIVQFVAVQKRMPCPADGSLPSTDANAGTETARDPVAGCTAQTTGVVPWRILGLAEQDATDGWNRRLTYRTDPVLGANNAMDMSACDPAGTGPLVGGKCNSIASGCSSTAPGSCTPPQTYLAGKGLEVHNLTGAIAMNPAAVPSTGAAYVVISPGETGGGGYLAGSGTLSATTDSDGNEEKKNYANVNPLPAYYVDDSLSDVAGATHFDDVVSRPSVLTVANKAGLGPRSH